MCKVSPLLLPPSEVVDRAPCGAKKINLKHSKVFIKTLHLMRSKSIYFEMKRFL